MKPNPVRVSPPSETASSVTFLPAMELKDLLTGAGRALAALDADRLEAIAARCAALRRSLGAMEPENWAALRQASIAAAGEMVVFGRVLAATRANMAVIERLRQLPEALEYCEPQARGWSCAEVGRGDH